MAGVTDQDLLKRMDKFHDEVVDFADKFAQSTKTLDDALKLAAESKKKWWVTHKALITTVVLLAALVLSTLCLASVMKATNMCLVTVGQAEPALTIRSCADVR